MLFHSTFIPDGSVLPVDSLDDYTSVEDFLDEIQLTAEEVANALSNLDPHRTVVLITSRQLRLSGVP